MNRYSVKQPQDIFIKIKIKLHGIEKKKNPGKKLNEIYIIAFILSVGQLVVQLYLHQEKLFTGHILEI